MLVCQSIHEGDYSIHSENGPRARNILQYDDVKGCGRQGREWRASSPPPAPPPLPSVHSGATSSSSPPPSPPQPHPTPAAPGFLKGDERKRKTVSGNLSLILGISRH